MPTAADCPVRLTLTLPSAPLTADLAALFVGVLQGTHTGLTLHYGSRHPAESLPEALAAAGREAADDLSQIAAWGHAPSRASYPGPADGAAAEAVFRRADAAGDAWDPVVDALATWAGATHNALRLALRMRGTTDALDAHLDARLRDLYPWLRHWGRDDAIDALRVFHSRRFRKAARAHATFAWATTTAADVALVRGFGSEDGVQLAEVIANPSLPPAVAEAVVVAWVTDSRHERLDQHTLAAPLVAWRARPDYHMSDALRTAWVALVTGPQTYTSAQPVVAEHLSWDPRLTAADRDILLRGLDNLTPATAARLLAHPVGSLGDVTARLASSQAWRGADNIYEVLAAQPSDIVPWSVLAPWVAQHDPAAMPEHQRTLLAARADAPAEVLRVIAGSATPSLQRLRVALAGNPTAMQDPTILALVLGSRSKEVLIALLRAVTDGDAWRKACRTLLQLDPDAALSHLATHGAPPGVTIPVQWLAPHLGADASRRRMLAMQALPLADGPLPSPDACAAPPPRATRRPRR